MNGRMDEWKFNNDTKNVQRIAYNSCKYMYSEQHIYYLAEIQVNEYLNVCNYSC